jgi:hypothetical protein
MASAFVRSRKDGVEVSWSASPLLGRFFFRAVAQNPKAGLTYYGEGLAPGGTNSFSYKILGNPIDWEFFVEGYDHPPVPGEVVYHTESYRRHGEPAPAGADVPPPASKPIGHPTCCYDGPKSPEDE